MNGACSVTGPEKRVWGGKVLKDADLMYQLVQVILVELVELKGLIGVSGTPTPKDEAKEARPTPYGFFGEMSENQRKMGNKLMNIKNIVDELKGAGKT